MLKLVASMYITLMPILLAGLANAVFCHTKLLAPLRRPMDGGRVLRDGERLFGDNKTWKGFLGYIVLGTVFAILWGWIAKAVPTIEEYDFFYMEHTIFHGCEPLNPMTTDALGNEIIVNHGRPYGCGGHENFVGYNALTGALQGLFYALFELPNSFLKRRMHIVPGQTTTGWKRGFFIFLDQADSLFGVVLVVCLFFPMPLWFYFLYVFIGAATHIVLNMLLYVCRVRKNMF